ncbi:hypothetical protein [Micromonospora sp. NPDC048830]|uniref:hypothetical protein n=1 Tax=Micromonospora sp. NPDC048830 TaxID=3364257 RepID=UPI00371A56A8
MTVATGKPAASSSSRHDRRFQTFWSAQILSVLGDSFSQLAARSYGAKFANQGP